MLGQICANYNGNAQTTALEAWEGEIAILQEVLTPWSGEDAHIIFEYNIPRLGKRIDVVLLLRGLVFCLEFKVGQKDKLQADVEQVLDYALDLKNFHLYSWERTIVPILIPTKYDTSTDVLQMSAYSDSIVNPLITGADSLQSVIKRVIEKYVAASFSSLGKEWIISPYSPTPSIVEAARSLYATHTVEDITRHEADNVSTDRIVKYILDVIRRSKIAGDKSICFVTGVPGAGKTLVGLDVAVKQTYQGQSEPVKDESAVYLSGNGPLVAVLTEALALDHQRRCKSESNHINLTDSRREVHQFIQIIHRYRDNMLGKIKNPIANGVLEIDPEKAVELDGSGYAEVEHVAIFDEAQRSWTRDKLAGYLKTGGTYGNKMKVKDFPMSEAAFLIWSLNQRKDWATIVCLVGGGQEIHTGEAGISEWIYALNEMFPHWKVYISDKLTEPEYAEGKVNELLKDNHNVTYSEDLHLAVSLRSFRAEKLSSFVHYLLSFDPRAKDVYAEIKDKYPIMLTRDMEKARGWLRAQARGTQRTGVLVSKAAARFKPLAVHILGQSDKDAVHWFLDDKTDVRASNYLEDAATEFQVQGLELDYTCLLWDADMRYDNGSWRYYTFNGQSDWKEIVPDTKNENKKEQIRYMLNAYRVLLTRARIGMVICVPSGNPNKDAAGFWEDPTRLPEYYDGTYNYLKSLGLQVL